MDQGTLTLMLTLAIPLIAALLAAVIRWGWLRDGIAVLMACGLLANVLKLLQIFMLGGAPLQWQALPMMSGLSLSFSVEPLGMIFALLVAFLWVPSTLYAIGYMRENNESHLCRFYAFFALSIAATLGIALSANLLTLFMCYEVLTLSTYPLVAHDGSREAQRAGRTYLVMLLGTSMILLLPAILYTFSVTGTLDFVKGGILQGKASPLVSAILLGLYLYGIGKAALMPLHRWLPGAMVAPSPVSALLHAVAVVKAGAFTIIKVVVYIFGVDYLTQLIGQNWWYGGWMFWLAAATIVLASGAALYQDNLKRRLAYSTISQLSYIILATSLLAPKAIIAAAFHLVAHGLGKITLFFAAGSIETASHKTRVSQFSGIGRRMPWTMGAFTVGAFSLIGIPPAAGFISKWYVLGGAMEMENFAVIGIVVVSTIFNICYLLPVVYKAFFEKEEEMIGITIMHHHGEASAFMVIAMLITAIATIALFCAPGIIMELAKGVGG